MYPNSNRNFGRQQGRQGTAFRSRLQSDPWDVGAWEQLLGDFQGRMPTPDSLTEQRSLYEDFLARFPTAAGYWKSYAEAELMANNVQTVKSLFSRCLLSCASPDLWKSYLRFIKKMNESKGVEGMVEVRKAYEYTLDRIGHDITAGPLWQEYINFLQAPRSGTDAYKALYSGGPAGQEDAHRTTILRRAYHRAIAIPTHTVDQIWRSYENFENSGGNKTLARRIVDEYKSKYQAARMTYQVRKQKLEGINFFMLAVPPEQAGSTQQQQVTLWKEYIAYERSNPQRLAQTDLPMLNARIALAYDQSVMCLYHYPEVWYDYVMWHLEGGGQGEASALAVLQRARKALPQCLLLHFTAADVEESRGNVDKAEELYNGLLEGCSEEQAAAGTAPPRPSVELPVDLASLVWIQFMRFARRSKGVKEMRKVFMRASKWKKCGWQVYVFSALSEWHGQKDEKVARNIFELGFKNHNFLSEPAYVLQYIDFLTGLGDISNARAVFERALTDNTNPESSRHIWDGYVRFEYEQGALGQAMEVERRRKEALGNSGGAMDRVSLHMLKYRFIDVWPCSSEQRAHFLRLLGMLPPTEQQQPSPQDGRPTPDRSSGPHPSPLHPQASPGPAPQPGWSQPPEFVNTLPPELSTFISALPPPYSLTASPRDIDIVIDTLMKWKGDMPPTMGAEAATAKQESPGDGGLGTTVNGGDAAAAQRDAMKRKPGNDVDGDDGDGLAGNRPPVFDAFRMRRKQRVGRVGGPEG